MKASLKKTAEKFIKVSSASLMLACTALFSAIVGYNGILPDEVRIYKGEQPKFDNFLRVSQNDSSNGSYDVSLKLFGAVPVKRVKVDEVGEDQVVVSGEPFGIKIFTKGVMVVGMTDVVTAQNKENPAYKAGIRVGDIITELDGLEVQSNEEVAEVIERSEGRPVKAQVIRSGKQFSCQIHPARSEDGSYKIGIWVRDSSAGLGTMTFYSPISKNFAGLGHAICDVDTGLVLPLESGEIFGASIESVEKSGKGKTGELCGTLQGEAIGSLDVNNTKGLYGRLYKISGNVRMMTVAHAGEIKTGKAKILTSIDNSGAKYYDCLIEKIDKGKNAEHNLVIRVTDKTLLNKTGGIVHGMSGSPIVQNGKLVGAVTHVFVNDPTKGYGIFAENMLGELQTVSVQKTKKAS